MSQTLAWAGLIFTMICFGTFGAGVGAYMYLTLCKALLEGLK